MPAAGQRPTTGVVRAAYSVLSASSGSRYRLSAMPYQSDPNPLFTSSRIHWRSDRIEWAVRVGLGPWLLDEISADRAFFSPVP